MRPTDWQWQQWLPYHHVVLLHGLPGTYKTTLLTTIAALRSKGLRIFDDPRPPDGPPAATVYLSGQGSLEETFKPRYLAAGGDPRYLTYMNGLLLPRDWGKVQEAATDTNAELLVFDPYEWFLQGYIGHYSAAKETVPLIQELVRRRRMLAILSRHVSGKGGSRSLSSRAVGSDYLLRSVQISLLLAHDPEDRDRLVLIATRAWQQPPMGLVFATAPTWVYDDQGREYEVERMIHLGECDYREEDLLKKGKELDERGYIAEGFLTELFAGGRFVWSQDLWALALLRGLSSRTVQRAMKPLGITGRRWGKSGPGCRHFYAREGVTKIWPNEEDTEDQKATREDSSAGSMSVNEAAFGESVVRVIPPKQIPFRRPTLDEVIPGPRYN
jgi:hypothetical protein